MAEQSDRTDYHSIAASGIMAKSTTYVAAKEASVATKKSIRKRKKQHTVKEANMSELVVSIEQLYLMK